MKTVSLLTRPLLSNNPVTVQILGICSALAVTTSMITAVTMCGALTVVLCSSSMIISLLQRHIPPSTRLIIQITIIASLVIVVDLLLKAYLFEISQQLSVFVSLIVTNCLVLGRAEAFAMQHTIRESLMDALGNSAGYSLVLVIIASVRELFSSGSLFGVQVFALASEGGWFEPLAFMLKAPSVFFIIGLLVWAANSRKRPAEHTTLQHHTSLVINSQSGSHD